MNAKFGILICLLSAIAGFTACQSAAPANNDMELAAAHQRLYAAVKSKNTEEIKKNMSKTTLEFAEGMAQTRNITLDEMLKNGFTETTMGDKIPAYRDERIKDDMGAIEVQNPKGQWEDLPFVKEDNVWKLAVGDIFKGTYKLPAPPASAKDRPKMENVPVQPSTMSNANMMPAPQFPPAPGNGNAAAKPNANAPAKKVERATPEKK